MIARLHAALTDMDNYAIPQKEEEEERLAPGIQPRLRLFFVPVINGFFWGTSLKVCVKFNLHF